MYTISSSNLYASIFLYLPFHQATPSLNLCHMLKAIIIPCHCLISNQRFPSQLPCIIIRGKGKGS